MHPFPRGWSDTLGHVKSFGEFPEGDAFRQIMLDTKEAIEAASRKREQSPPKTGGTVEQ